MLVDGACSYYLCINLCDIQTGLGLSVTISLVMVLDNTLHSLHHIGGEGHRFKIVQGLDDTLLWFGNHRGVFLQLRD